MSLPEIKETASISPLRFAVQKDKGACLGRGKRSWLRCYSCLLEANQ